jgi:2-polyprenyl-6-methoxyphenol hydroxylase-like FAD-dependent oxidoreductase
VTHEHEAIVIGGGIAGLLAARVLADHFDWVTLLERDVLPDRPETRRATPQTPHSHVLGSSGYHKLVRLFPGLDEDLAAAGARQFDYFADCRTYAGRWMPRFSSGLVSRMATRMLLEHAIRRRLSDLDRVVVRDGQRVERIVVDEQGRASGVAMDDGSRVSASFVVDAAGLGSRTRRLLQSIGLGEAPEARVDLRSGTTTQLFRPPASPTPDWIALFVRATPDNPRIGALTCIEGGLWRLSVSGLGGLYPPKTAEGLLAFTRELASPEIHDLVREAEPASEVFYYGASFSRWLRYDRLDRFPDGLAVVGDAVFHANPEHAQGMTFCLLAAETLAAMLGEPDRPLLERAGSSLVFQRRLARLYRPYWVWNAAIELGIPDVTDHSDLSGPERWEMAFYQRLRAVASRDRELLCAVARVTQGEHRPSRLFRPKTLRRLARARRKALEG